MEVAIESARWLTIFEIHHAQVPHYRVGRVFLAGDAAHVHSPAGGLGMNTGIQDAFNLSWKLALASRGEASAALLDSYHDERHPVAAEVIRFTTALTKAGTLDSPFARALRNAAMKAALSMPPARHAMANEIEQMTVEYRYSPLLGSRHHGSVRPGDAVRHVPGVDLWSTLAHRAPTGTGHAAVLVADADGALPSVALPKGVSVVQVVPEVGDGAIADPERRVAQRYGLHHGGVVVARPDGYVAVVAGPGDSAEIAEYFASVSVAS